MMSSLTMTNVTFEEEYGIVADSDDDGDPAFDALKAELQNVSGGNFKPGAEFN